MRRKIFLLSIIIIGIQASSIPVNQYAYMKARDELKSSETKSQNIDLLSKKERIVNLYLENMKEDEILSTKKKFYPALPIEDHLTEIINRPLYLELKNVPKGGNLHMHESQILDRKKFLELVKQLPEYDNLYVCLKNHVSACSVIKKCTCTDYVFKYFRKNVELGYVKVSQSGVSFDYLASKSTLIGALNSQNPKVLPTDSSTRWNIAVNSELFNIYDDLFQLNSTRYAYMKTILDNSLKENSQILEFRRSGFGKTFYFNSSGDRNLIDAEEELETLRKFKEDYIKSNPKFIDFNFIVYGVRSFPKKTIKTILDTTIKLQKKYPDLIKGYDLVGEEDIGHTLLFHSDSLLSGLEERINSTNFLNYFFHAGETNNAEDDIPSQHQDSVSTHDNIYDALIFKTFRIGHGLAYFKHPNLYEHLINSNIAIEICPASNQILGFVPDLRNHPAINFYRSGIPIVIAGDDPGSFGYNEQTVEFYYAFLAWGLNLYDLKNIAKNSITYSSLTLANKQIGYEKFENVWNEYIDLTYDKACNLKIESNVNITNVLPTNGPPGLETNITIFGFGFERAICKKVECQFGHLITLAEQIHIDEIKCSTPVEFQSDDKVSIDILIDGVKYETGFSFSFSNAYLN